MLRGGCCGRPGGRCPRRRPAPLRRGGGLPVSRSPPASPWLGVKTSLFGPESRSGGGEGPGRLRRSGGGNWEMVALDVLGACRAERRAAGKGFRLAGAAGSGAGALPAWQESASSLSLFLKRAECFQNGSLDRAFLQTLSVFFQFHKQVFHSLSIKIMMVSNCGVPPVLPHSLLSEAFFFSCHKQNQCVYP